MKHYKQGIITIVAIILFTQSASASTTMGQIDLSGSDVSLIPMHPEMTDIASINLFFSEQYYGNYVFDFIVSDTFVPSQAGANKYYTISSRSNLNLKNISSIDIFSEKDITVFQLKNNYWVSLPTQKITQGVYRTKIEGLGLFCIVPDTVIRANQVSDIMKKGVLVSVTEFIEGWDMTVYNTLSARFETFTKDKNNIIILIIVIVVVVYLIETLRPEPEGKKKPHIIRLKRELP